VASVEIFGEPNEESFGPPDVAEPIHVLVLDNITDELCATLAEPLTFYEKSLVLKPGWT
jgi:hypothetical protein